MLGEGERYFGLGGEKGLSVKGKKREGMTGQVLGGGGLVRRSGLCVGIVVADDIYEDWE